MLRFFSLLLTFSLLPPALASELSGGLRSDGKLDVIPPGAFISAREIPGKLGRRGEVRLSATTELAGVANLAAALPAGGGAAGDSLKISGAALRVSSSSSAKLAVEEGAEIRVLAGKWPGELAPPTSFPASAAEETAAAVILGGAAETFFSAGSAAARLDFGEEPAELSFLLPGGCPEKPAVARRSFGELAFSQEGISSVAAAAEGNSCRVSFKTRWLSTFAVGDAAGAIQKENPGAPGGGSSSSSSGGYRPPSEEEEGGEIAAPFGDLGGEWSWAAPFANRLRLAGVLRGKRKSVFAPMDPVTRAEILAIGFRLFGVETRELREGEIWSAPLVEKARQLDILPSGWDAAAPASRAETLAFLFFSAGIAAPTAVEVPFADVTPEFPFFSEISLAARKGVVAGFDDGSFRPEASVSRAAAAKIAVRTAELVNKELPE